MYYISDDEINYKDEEEEDEEVVKNYCCYCKEECSIHSQCCGRCARGLTNWSLGHELPTSINFNLIPDTEPKTDSGK